MICAIIPIVYACLMILMPESPNFHLMKGNVEKARLSLRYFRGPYGTVDQELTIMQDSLAKVHAYHFKIKYQLKRQMFLCRLKEKEFR